MKIWTCLIVDKPAGVLTVQLVGEVCPVQPWFRGGCSGAAPQNLWTELSVLSTFWWLTHSLRCHTGIGRREEGGRVFWWRGGAARAEEPGHQGGQ